MYNNWISGSFRLEVRDVSVILCYMDQLLLSVPKTQLKTERGGGSAFSVITPKLWYDLPAHVRMAIFKTRPNLNVVVDDFSAVFWHFVQHFVRLCCKGCSINKIGLD